MTTSEVRMAAMSEAVLARMHRDDEWRLAFERALAGLVYDLIHTDCEPGCVCEPGRSGIKTGDAR